jgi:RimJ/RimL family protein N-acetyltransferase
MELIKPLECFSPPPKIILQNDVCVLVPFSDKDVTQDYVDWLNNPNINRYLESRFSLHTINSVLLDVNTWISCPYTFFYTIRCPNSNKHVGNIKLGPINPHHMTCNVAYLMGDMRFVGKGFATNALLLLTEYVFSVGVRKVTAGAYELNKASLRVMQKAGFSFECFHPSHVIFEGRIIGSFELSKISN